MERSEVYIGQRVLHVRRGFTGTVAHLRDPHDILLFGVKVDARYLSTLEYSTNYHDGFYWAAAFNLEPLNKPFYLISPIFMEVSE